MKKGFTLIEILASIVILSILLAIGVVSYRYLIQETETGYYETLEQELLIVGNDYYNDNLIDRPLTGYHSVDINRLVENDYIEPLKDHNGNDTCQGEIFIYKNDLEYDYEACLVCQNYRSSGNYCNGKIPGVIFISAKEKEGSAYNALLSYENVNYSVSERIDVTFTILEEVTKYIITNTQTNEKRVCSATDNACTMSFNNNQGGSYQVESYQNDIKVSQAAYFNIKFDKEAPNFDFENKETEFVIIEGTTLNYQNRVINLQDDTGIKSVKYTITNKKTGEDITNDLIINESLEAGIYTLSVTVTDNSNRSVTKELKDIKIGYKVKLQYDNREDEITVFLNQKYGSIGYLPDNDNTSDKTISWRNEEGEITTNDTLVTKTTPHTLYAKDHYTITFNSNGNSFSGENNITTRTCVENNDGSCIITCPVIVANSNTPTVIGYSLNAETHTNDSSYNASNNTVTVNENKTYYAQTKKDGKTLTVSYSKGTGVSDIGKTNDSCSYETVYNGASQSTSCTINVATITTNTCYSASGWYSGSSKICDASGNCTINSSHTLVANASAVSGCCTDWTTTNTQTVTSCTEYTSDTTKVTCTAKDTTTTYRYIYSYRCTGSTTSKTIYSGYTYSSSAEAFQVCDVTKNSCPSGSTISCSTDSKTTVDTYTKRTRSRTCY